MRVSLENRVTHIRSWLTVAACLAVVFSHVAVAGAVDAPHVPGEEDTDACAICHRTHTPASDVGWQSDWDTEPAGNALIIGAWVTGGDTGLCYVCHGVDSLGASSDVQSGFTSESAHLLDPDLSDYGPPEKQCSSCHDSHGTDKDTDGDSYAALLRARSTTNTALERFKGDEYCTACHQDRVDSTFDGFDIWSATAHSREITPPASGTEIVCSSCHDPHGSDNPPLIVEKLLAPAAPTTLTVPANDRYFCMGCHASSWATWVGYTRYGTSTHAQSETTVTIAGEWPSADASRTVGECQNCHAPMGSADANGDLVPKLVEKPSRQMCDTCHSASNVATDVASLAFPDTASSDPELAVTLDPKKLASAYGRLFLYTRETTGTTPLDLTGPRKYSVASRAGDIAAGDIDADGEVDLVMADPANKRLEVFSRDTLKGISSVTYSIDATPAYVVVADVFVDGTGRPEIAVVTKAATSPYASNLYIYRLTGASLTRLTGPVSVGNDASGLASGDVTAGVAPDLAVTSAGDDTLRIFAESQTSPGTLVTGGPYSTRSQPRGPSIGDAWDGSTTVNEIAVANSGEVTGTVSIFSGAGTLLGSYNATGIAGAVAYATLVADVLPNVTGQETVVALRHETATSSVNVFPRTSGGGLGTRQNYATGKRYATSSLLVGDVDGSSGNELVVGNAGVWSSTASAKQVPSIQVFRANASGTGLTSTPAQTLFGGGAETAGSPPGLALADMGPIGESRHPVGAVPDTHVSTEVATITRHVECTDCHNVHEATSTPTVATGTPPAVIGRLKGAWGVQVTNAPAGSITLTERRGVLYEYEVCMKCHANGWSDLDGARDIASEFDTRNASFHAVEASSSAAQNRSGSFVSTSPAWSSTSTLYCSHCHGNADATEASGLHTSEDAPILLQPYWGVTSDLSSMVCYRCHKYSVYYTGVEDTGTTGSNFYDNILTESRLHYLHVNGGSSGHGYACGACHVSHGIDTEHLIRDEVGFTHNSGGGGSCDNACHSTSHSYDGS